MGRFWTVAVHLPLQSEWGCVQVPLLDSITCPQPLATASSPLPSEDSRGPPLRQLTAHWATLPGRQFWSSSDPHDSTALTPDLHQWGPAPRGLTPQCSLAQSPLTWGFCQHSTSHSTRYSSYLLLRKKSPQNVVAQSTTNHFIISRGFHVLGIWEESS